MQLSETRRADRIKMVNNVCELAFKYGINAAGRFHNSDYTVELSHDGVEVEMQFEATSIQPNVFVLSWNTYGRDFLPSFAQNVNTSHYGKATDVAEGFDDLMQILEQRFTTLQNGRALESSQ